MKQKVRDADLGREIELNPIIKCSMLNNTTDGKISLPSESHQL